MNEKRILLLIIILFFAKSSFANDTIIVRKDPRIDILVQKQIQLNKRSTMSFANGQYKGFRVQIVSTSNRDEAFKIKADLLAKFPEEKTYIIFQSPNFKVRIGNFLKREDAEKLRDKIQNNLSQTIYIVEDAIEYTPTEEEINQ